ncbi:MAG: hypothetical protein LKJ94_07305 [Candidatus Methanomethylophilus sp.]|nr:hypothetical protein [Methanomethylophilus sp.]MCI2075478.1 hypothetical protein [Methanomethylophilus sp.]MCI2093300.1 hypothetical protein [Methanomethylophilus sp.]
MIAPDSASVVPGIIMSAGGAQRLALYDPSSGKVSVGGTSYDGIGISIKAAGGDALTVSMTGELERRHGLMSAVASTMGQADGSAWAVWQIFTDAGSASAYLTTLSVPNEYEDIGMTASQKRIMAVLSLQELAGYWNSTGGSLLKEYKVTGGSNALFIRGDIMDGQGNTVAKDAVFTPYYRVNDDRIELGSNTQHQAATVAVWASGYTGTLSAWGRSTDSPFLITSQSGYVFDAAEIEYGGESVSSADLDVRQIDYIDPEKISVSPTPTPPAGGDDWTKMIIIAFIVLAVLLAFTGITHGRPELVVIGIIAAAVGIAGADTINGWIVDGFSIGGLLG